MRYQRRQEIIVPELQLVCAYAVVLIDNRYARKAQEREQPEGKEKAVNITRELVKEKVEAISKDQDLSRYIL